MPEADEVDGMADRAVTKYPTGMGIAEAMPTIVLLFKDFARERGEKLKQQR